MQDRLALARERLTALAADLMQFDTTARYPGNRELWRAVINAPDATQSRYRRLCQIVARLSIRGHRAAADCLDLGAARGRTE